MELLEIALIISGSGTLGGIVAGMTRNTTYTITLPAGKRLDLGFLGDAFVGATAAIAVFAFAGSMLNIDLEHLSKPQEFIKAIAVSVSAGFAGISLIKKLSDNLISKVDEVSDKLESINLQEKSNEFKRQARFFLDNKQFEEAIVYYDHALKIYPKNNAAVCGKGAVMKRLGNIEEAWKIITDLTVSSPQYQAAWYNKACYGALLNKPNSEILADLKKAINLFDGFKLLASKDPDFNNMHKDPEFNSLTGRHDA